MSGITRSGLTFDQVFSDAMKTSWGVETIRLLKLPPPATDPVGKLIDISSGYARRLSKMLAAACYETLWTRLPHLEGEDTAEFDAALLTMLKADAPDYPWSES